MHCGPLGRLELDRRAEKGRALRDEARARALRDCRQRAEWRVALLCFAEAMGQPIAFRKRDLLALRK